MSWEPVVVVSAFGRGHWLAAGISQLGIPTTLVDVSENLGSLILEEIEGPFGFFQTDDFKEPPFMEWLSKTAEHREIPQGFVLWLKSGPLEMRGPLTSHRLEKFSFFERSSLRRLHHGYWSHEFDLSSPSPESSREDSVISFFSNPFFVRWIEKSHYQTSLNWCAEKGVEIISGAKVVDISRGLVTGRIVRGSGMGWGHRFGIGVRGIEVRETASKSSKHLSGARFIWCLSSEETHFMSPNVASILFSNGILEPDWAWVRFQIDVSPTDLSDRTPSHVLIIEELARPWTHDNFIVLQRSGTRSRWDLWMRLASSQQRNREYLRERGQESLQIIETRWPGARIEIVHDPSEQVGPGRQPIYLPQRKKRWGPSALKNIDYCSVEQQEGLGFGHQMKLEISILKSMEKDILKMKQKGKDQDDREIHSP